MPGPDGRRPGGAAGDPEFRRGSEGGGVDSGEGSGVRDSVGGARVRGRSDGVEGTIGCDRVHELRGGGGADEGVRGSRVGLGEGEAAVAGDAGRCAWAGDGQRGGEVRGARGCRELEVW